MSGVNHNKDLKSLIQEEEELTPWIAVSTGPPVAAGRGCGIASSMTTGLVSSF